MAASNLISDIKVNRDLLDANFDGYKLSLDALPIYTSNLDAIVDNPKLPNELYSYQHLKAFGVINKLFADPWCDDVVYFIDCHWRIRSCRLESNLTYTLSPPKTHLIMEDEDERMKLNEYRVAPSLYFINSEWLVTSDGAGRLYIVKTGIRSHDKEWKICYKSDEAIGHDKCFILLHSTVHNLDKQMFIEVLCLHIDKNLSLHQDNTTSMFVTTIDWFTFTSGDGMHFELCRSRSLRGKTSPDYAAILSCNSSGEITEGDHVKSSDNDHGDNANVNENNHGANNCKLVIISEKQFEFVADSLSRIESRNASKVDLKSSDDVQAEAGEVNQPIYTWTQKDKDITVYLKLNDETKKEDISCAINIDNINLQINSNNIFSSGLLGGKVKVDECTWFVNDKSLLEICLTKVDGESVWEELFVGDKRGQLIFDDEQIATINERLAPFTADNLDGDETEQKSNNFNLGQLEDCDEVDKESYKLICYGGETHKIINQIDLSNNQWLFESTNTRSNLPFICIRLDVDGLVFQFNQPSNLEMESSMLKHIATFNAFGYVQASKQQKKFTVCPPNFSYVAIVDCVKHVFLYKQPSLLLSPLRNRKTGESMNKIAKQYLISLDNTDIDGAVAYNEHLFILSGQSLHCVRINRE